MLGESSSNERKISLKSSLLPAYPAASSVSSVIYMLSINEVKSG